MPTCTMSPTTTPLLQSHHLLLPKKEYKKLNDNRLHQHRSFRNTSTITPSILSLIPPPPKKIEKCTIKQLCVWNRLFSNPAQIQRQHQQTINIIMRWPITTQKAFMRGNHNEREARMVLSWADRNPQPPHHVPSSHFASPVRLLDKKICVVHHPIELHLNSSSLTSSSMMSTAIE